MKGIASILSETYSKYDSFNDVPWSEILKSIGAKYLYPTGHKTIRFEYKSSYFMLEDNGGEVHVVKLEYSNQDVPYSLSAVSDDNAVIAAQLKKQLEKLV